MFHFYRKMFHFYRTATAFLLFHVKKIRHCKTLSANVLKNFLKKVSKRFAKNV